MKWSHWCITASLSYKNTMINRITMETFACLRSKCHLKQNLILSWPWSFRHTSCISDFRCKTKYTSKKFCRTTGPAYLAVLPVLVIFCPLGPMNFKKSAYIQSMLNLARFISFLLYKSLGMLGQRTGKTNNLKVFRKNKTKGINSIAKIILRLSIPEGDWRWFW